MKTFTHKAGYYDPIQIGSIIYNKNKRMSAKVVGTAPCGEEVFCRGCRSDGVYLVVCVEGDTHTTRWCCSLWED